jgi:integrase
MAILAQCPVCKSKRSLRLKRCRCGADLDKAKKNKRIQYWIDYALPNGKTRRECVGDSLAEARDAEGNRRRQKRENRFFEIVPDAKRTFGQLSEWFLGQEKVKALSYFVPLQSHLKLFNEFFGKKLVGSLQPADLESLQVRLGRRDYSPSYIDQIIDSARYMVTKALDNDLIGGDCLKPFRKVKAVLKAGANARQRVLSIAEYKALCDGSPKHTRGIVALGFWSGMRIGEILNLQWDQVDLSARMIRLRAKDTKEGMPKSVPLSKTMREILFTLPNRGKSVFVFAPPKRRKDDKEAPLRDIREALRIGCKAAGIAFGRDIEGGFVFHDLRHCFSTYARRAGVPRRVVMAIMGHSTGGDMHARYDLVEDSDLLAAIDQVERVFSENLDQNLDQWETGK